MPPDSRLSDSLITEYDEILEFCKEHPDTEYIPLLLNSFGERGGLGVYQLVEDFLLLFTPEQVLPHLARALLSEHPSIRYWSAQFASHFPAPELIEPLGHLLEGDEEDIRSAAAIALRCIDDVRAEEVIREALRYETDLHVRSLLQAKFAGDKSVPQRTFIPDMV